MTVTVTLDTSGPADPAYILEVARAVAEGMRVLGHLTRHPEAFRDPADTERVLREISSAAARAPQVLDQVNARIRAWHEAGELGVASGMHAGYPGGASFAVACCVDEAGKAASRMVTAIDSAADVTSAMTLEGDSGE